MKTKLLLIAIIFLVIPTIMAQTYNETLASLDQASLDMLEMQEAGFTTIMINDTLTEANQLFEAQRALELQGGKSDYSSVLTKTIEIAQTKQKAFETWDELEALRIRIESLDYDSEALVTYSTARTEFQNERYDLALEAIEEAHMKISEEEASRTRVTAIALAGTKTIAGFFTNNWKEICIFLATIFFFWLFFHKKIQIALIDRKISNLRLEKEVLQEMIKKSQYEYFHLLKMPEDVYNIRIEKFGELIRDIDRKIPLLVTEKEKIRSKIKETKEAK
jgi:hypothetical protein